ncbi:hypothetical protein [Sphingomonas nostoxanthinifaciens]|uniref:hypothetical protein n=1 Tax=Sphingomonas nostoxanthinifaciens TaxID=2872652 RepID=UPI001CC1E1C1|nr:hypothetical protein [Sphingomonas nostoxanthinifaciens]UAK24340.1 hypothetical protein K8P63_18840 [Sphingomonas nostoxanthinifaciens]
MGTWQYPNAILLDSGQGVTVVASVTSKYPSGNGTTDLQIQVSPSGQGTWGVIAEDSFGYASGEPGQANAGGTFYNSGPKQAFDLRAVVSQSGSYVGMQVNQSYMQPNT